MVKRNNMIYQNILELIGNTPLVRLNKLNPNPAVELLVKLEGQNPGGSAKDRIALAMISAAEASGELRPGKIILEPTSGNTGIGLALAGAVKGYEVVLAMSAAMSAERKQVIGALGAELIETDPDLGTDGAILKARELFEAEPEKYWLADQFRNPQNPAAHYQGTAAEIIRDVPDIRVFVAGLGSSGTLMGAGRRLKEYDPAIRIVGAEPERGQGIAGLKNLEESMVPMIYDEAVLDRKARVRDEQARELARRLAREEGILAGLSSGAVLAAALEEARRLDQGRIVALLPDRGERYLSAGLYG